MCSAVRPSLDHILFVMTHVQTLSSTTTVESSHHSCKRLMYVHSHTILKHTWPKTCEIFDVEIDSRRLLLLLLLTTNYQNRCAGMCRLFKCIIIQFNVAISMLNCPKCGFMLEFIFWRVTVHDFQQFISLATFHNEMKQLIRDQSTY